MLWKDEELEVRRRLPLHLLRVCVFILFFAAPLWRFAKALAASAPPPDPHERPPPPGFKPEYLPSVARNEFEAFGLHRRLPPPFLLSTDVFPPPPPFVSTRSDETAPIYPAGPVYGEEEFGRGYLTSPYDYTRAFLHSLKDIQDIQDPSVRKAMLSINEVESGEENTVGGRQEVKVRPAHTPP